MKKLVLAAAMGVILAPAAQAGPAIDLFDTDQAQLSDNTMGDGGVSSSVTTLGTDILGGERDLFVEKTGEFVGGVISNNPADNNLLHEATIGVAAGALGFSTSTLTAGTGVIQWDGADNSPVLNFGLGDVDLTDGGNYTAFVLNTLDADHDWEFTIGLYTSATQYSIVSLQAHEVDPVANPDGVKSTIPFLPFFIGEAICDADPNTVDCTYVGGGVDITKVNAIEVILNSGDPQALRLDLTLDSVQIPEPSTLAILSLGLLGLGGYARRKKAAS